MGLGRSGLTLVALLTLAIPAHAGDLGEALDYVARAVPSAQYEDLGHMAAPHKNDALAFLAARAVPDDKPLEDYDCLEDSRIDNPAGLSVSWTQNRRTIRECVMLQWGREKVKGYVTLGETRLIASEVDHWVQIAAEDNKLSPVMLHVIMTLISGYRPGLVAENGRVGIMQLPEPVLREYGVTNPLDPGQSILAAARYIGDLYDSYGVIELALAHFRGGPSAVAGGHVAKKPRIMWFVRAVRWEWKVNTRDFPVEEGWEHIALVTRWTDEPYRLRERRNGGD